MVRASLIACALLGALALPAAAQDQPPPAPPALPQEMCGIFSQTEADRVSYIPLDGYSILNATPPLTRPAGQEDVDGVMCYRASIFIGAQDHRVLTDLGVPLFIANGERIAVLELTEGQLRVRFSRGQPTPGEAEAMRDALDRAGEDMQRTAAR